MKEMLSQPIFRVVLITTLLAIGLVAYGLVANNTPSIIAGVCVGFIMLLISNVLLYVAYKTMEIMEREQPHTKDDSARGRSGF